MKLSFDCKENTGTVNRVIAENVYFVSEYIIMYPVTNSQWQNILQKLRKSAKRDQNIRGSHQSCSMKNVLLEISQSS